MDGGQKIQYATIFAAQAVVAYVWFSTYHRLQLFSAPRIKSHLLRSLLWATIFLAALPILMSPLIIGILFAEGLVAGEYASTSHPVCVIAAVLLSVGLGWFASYFPQRSRLRKIGAWGWLEDKDV